MTWFAAWRRTRSFGRRIPEAAKALDRSVRLRPDYELTRREPVQKTIETFLAAYQRKLYIR